MANKKSMTIIVTSIVVYIVCLAFCLHAQIAEAAKIPVNVLHTGKDEVGIRLVYHLKEQIRNSKAYRLSSAAERRLEILITTFDLADELTNSLKVSHKNIKSIVSVIITKNDTRGLFYINALLGSVGSSEVKEKAETILAMIDN